MRGGCRRGSAVVDVVMAGAMVVFLLFPVFSAVMERYILLNKIQIIKDAVDMTNISTYNAINADSLGKSAVILDDVETEAIYRSLLAKNLRLDKNLLPLDNSIAEGQVGIDSLLMYSGDFPLECPDGNRIERASIHSRLTIPVKPSLFRKMVLDLLGKEYVELKVHVDSELPVNN